MKARLYVHFADPDAPVLDSIYMDGTPAEGDEDEFDGKRHRVDKRRWLPEPGTTYKCLHIWVVEIVEREEPEA